MTDFTDPTPPSGFDKEFNDAHFATAAPKSVAAPAQELPWYEKMIQGVKDPFNAAAQLLMRSTEVKHQLGNVASIVSGGGLFPNRLSETIAGAGESVDTSIKKGEQAYQAKRKAAEPMTLGSLVTGQRPEPGIDWWRGLGNVSNPVNWIGGGSTGLTANVLRGGLSAGLTMPVSGEGDFATEKAKQVGTGALAAGVLTPVAAGVGRVISPQTSEEAKKLLQSGVTLTPGQIAGGWAKRLEDAATSIPFLGDLIKSAQGRSIVDFNRATYQRALDPVGEKAPSVIGHEGVEKVADILGAKYDALLPKVNFRPDATTGQELAGLRHMVALLPEAQQKQFNNIFTTQLGKAAPGGAMEGETLKGVLSTIRQESKGYGADSSFDNRKLSGALNELHNILTRTVQRANPAQAAELKAIDTGWANYARIRSAAASQGATDGVFTPAHLSSAVKALDKSVGKGDFAKGNALLQDLSGPGKNVLGSKVPDSGTPFRSLTAWGLSGGLGYLANAHPLAAAASVAGMTLGSLPYTQAGQKVMAKVMAERPDVAPQIADFARRALLSGAAPASAMTLKEFAP